MARRKRTGTAEDLMDLVALLPWWAGIGLALLSYLILHALASVLLPSAKTPQDIGQLVTRGIWHGLANAGQFILPLICAIGALIFTVRRREHRALVNTVTQSKAVNPLDGMTWKQFELLVGEGRWQQGYTVVKTGGGGAESGVDLAPSKGREELFVQWEQWEGFKVGVAEGAPHRIARRGIPLDDAFWGCFAYLGCEGTRSIAAAGGVEHY